MTIMWDETFAQLRFYLKNVHFPFPRFMQQNISWPCLRFVTNIVYYSLACSSADWWRIFPFSGTTNHCGGWHIGLQIKSGSTILRCPHPLTRTRLRPSLLAAWPTHLARRSPRPRQIRRKIDGSNYQSIQQSDNTVADHVERVSLNYAGCAGHSNF